MAAVADKQEAASKVGVTSPPKSTRKVGFLELFRFADPTDKGLYLLGGLFSVFTGITFPLFSLIFAGLLDAFFVEDPVTVISRYAGYLGLIGLANLIGGILGLGTILFVAERQGTKMRKAYLTALLRSEIGWHDVNHSLEAATRMSEDIGAVLKGLGEPLANTIQFGTQFIAGVVMGFIRDWKISLVVLAFVPFLALAGAGMKLVLSDSAKKESDAYARAGEIASETIGSIRTVQAYCAEEAEVKRYDKNLVKAEKMGRFKGMMQGISMGGMWLAMLTTYGVALWFGSTLIISSRNDNAACYSPTSSTVTSGCVTGGTVVNVFFAIIIAAFAISQAAPNLSTFGAATGAAASVFDLIDRQPEIDNLSTTGLTPDPSTVKGKLEFRNVTFAYPSRPSVRVLDNFSLVIEAGTNVALVGPSGCGKSSLVALVQRWYSPQEGVILLDDIPLQDYNIQWLRERYGLVLQDPILFEGSVARNIALGLPEVARGARDVTDADVQRLMPQIQAAAHLANATSFIEKLPNGYFTEVGEKGGKLSGGQRQRVCIARSLMREPAVLLNDEATSALDTASERLVQKAIDNLLLSGTTGTRRNKMTSITIAHRLSTIRNCDRIVVIEAGRIITAGTHDELMREDKDGPKGLYRRLVEQQALGDGSSGNSNNEAATSGKVVSRHASSRKGTRSRSQTAGIALPASPGGVDVAAVAAGLEEAVASSASSSPADNDDEEEAVEEEEEGGEDDAVEAKAAVVDAAAAAAAASSADHTAVALPNADKDKKEDKNDKKVAAAEPELPPVPFSRVMGMQKPERPHLVIAIIASLIAGAVMPCFSIVFSEMMTAFYNPSNSYISSTTPKLMGAFIGLGAISFVSQFLMWYLFAVVGEKLTRRLRVATYRAVLYQEIGWFDKEENSTGKVTTRLSEEAALIRATTGDKLALTCQSVASLVAGLVIAFRASWQVALLMLAVFPLIAIVGASQIKLLSGMTSTKESEAVGGVVAEAMSSIRTVYAFGLQNLTLTRFTDVLGPVEKKGIKRAWTTGAGMGASMMVLFGSYALVFWAGGEFVNNGWTTFQNLLEAFFAITLAAQGAGQASGLATDVGKAEKAKRSIFAIIDSRPNIDARSKVGERPSLVRGAVEFRDVHFAYPTRAGQEILKGISIKIEAGKTTALVGPSGSGKSSIVSLLQRFYDPTSGEVLLDGIDIKLLPPAYLRSKLALVPQMPTLFSDSVEYAVGYPNVLPDAGVAVDAGPNATIPSTFVHDPENEEACKAANAHGFITSFPHGYATHCGTGGSALSGGQKSRLAIARAIRRKPAVYEFDEATSSLDANSEAIVQASIDNLAFGNEGSGATKLIVAHKLATVRNADKICVINEGKVVEEGTHLQLLAKEDGVYRQLALAQDPSALSALNGVVAYGGSGNGSGRSGNNHSSASLPTSNTSAASTASGTPPGDMAGTGVGSSQ